jgi:DNA polymerase-3 subunit beta
LFEAKLQGTETTVKLVGTDGRRLALVERKMATKVHKDLKTIIPFKTIQELLRNVRDEGSISIGIGPTQAFFEMDGTVIISRLIEGDFPDYQRVIPAASHTKIILEKESFMLALRRANLLTTPDFQAVKFELFKGKLVISKATPDVGEFREEIALEHTGREFMIGFNPTYFLDMLKNWPEDRFALEMFDPEKPGVVRSGEYVYILQPMRLN